MDEEKRLVAIAYNISICAIKFHSTLIVNAASSIVNTSVKINND
jgi:hypothetical protein